MNLFHKFNWTKKKTDFSIFHQRNGIPSHWKANSTAGRWAAVTCECNPKQNNRHSTSVTACYRSNRTEKCFVPWNGGVHCWRPSLVSNPLIFCLRANRMFSACTSWVLSISHRLCMCSVFCLEGRCCVCSFLVYCVASETQTVCRNNFREYVSRGRRAANEPTDKR